MEQKSQLLDGMEQMPRILEDPFGEFKKKTYRDSFDRFFAACRDTFTALDEVYEKCGNRESLLTEAALAFVEPVEKEIDEIGKKSKREQKILDYCFFIVTYVIPAIGEWKSEAADQLADELLVQWKAKFPKTNLQKASLADIESGFQKKLCYISTAVCQSLGKPDDCYELNVLREYRDKYLMSRPEGEKLVMEYYDVAPTIVNRIQKREDSSVYFARLWKEYITVCIRYIEDGENQACLEYYRKMVEELKKDLL